jgi:hypothetical protein
MLEKTKNFIKLETRDSYIWNLNEKIIEIIKKAISSDDNIYINTNNEGPCLHSCGLYNKLDLICNTFGFDKQQVVIYTPNIEERHDTYKIIIHDNIWVDICKKHNLNSHTIIKKPQLKSVGCFVGKINWARLVLLSWLDYYPDKAQITCHYKYSNDDSDLPSQSSLQLTDNFLKFPNELGAISDFLMTCPRTLPSNFKIQSNSAVTLQEIIDIAVNFTEGYSDIFAELVCETYFTGFTFFPTEKTFRPIMQLTPFIIFGPQGFLTNLHRCGFKTFNQYWDESYDECVGTERIIKIKQVLTELFKLDQPALEKMYDDMRPILEHNKHRLSTLTPKDLLLDE